VNSQCEHAYHSWIEDLKTMEKITLKSINELVKTSLMMFIATRNDILGGKTPIK